MIQNNNSLIDLQVKGNKNLNLQPNQQFRKFNNQNQFHPQSFQNTSQLKNSLGFNTVNNFYPQQNFFPNFNNMINPNFGVNTLNIGGLNNLQNLSQIQPFNVNVVNIVNTGNSYFPNIQDSIRTENRSSQVNINSDNYEVSDSINFQSGEEKDKSIYGGINTLNTKAPNYYPKKQKRQKSKSR